MTKLAQDLELAHALIENTNKIREYYSLFEKMWPFTTINMREYLAPFDLQGKRCMTIQGSSDHIFELFLKHPQQITGVDTNPLTEYYFYLKQAGFKVLKNNEEYLKFFRWYDYPNFCKQNNSAFAKDVFLEIEKYLIGDAKLFWKELFECYNPIAIRRNLFNQYDETNNQALYQALTYLDEDNYQYIRNNIDKINFNFLNLDIRSVTEHLIENYDFITLSNLIIYANDMYEQNPLEGFKKIIETLKQKLNENGNIVVGYLYDIEDEEDYRDIYKSKIRNLVFPQPEFYYHYFTKMHDLHCDWSTNNHDAILIYTKK